MDEIFERISLWEWYCYCLFVTLSIFAAHNLLTAVISALGLVMFVMPIFIKKVMKEDLFVKEILLPGISFLVIYSFLLALVFNEGAYFDKIISTYFSKFVFWVVVWLLATLVYLAIRYFAVIDIEK